MADGVVLEATVTSGQKVDTREVDYGGGDVRHRQVFQRRDITTATLASVSAAATSTALQAANAARLEWSCFNNSSSNLYLKFGTGATTSSFKVLVPPMGYYEMPNQHIYKGVIHGIWDTATGAALVEESV